MTAPPLSPREGELFAAIQFVEMPMFLVSMDPDGTPRFVGVNPAHTRLSGVETAAIAGKSPHEAFPTRLADTVDANYRKCAAMAGPYTYREVLDLPAGRSWWRTTLVPITEGRRVATILGSAIDITASKHQIDTLTEEAVQLRNKIMRSNASSAAILGQMRGPLNNIVALSRLLRAEFQPPLERKEQILSMLVDTAVQAIGEIDRLEQEGGTIRIDPREIEPIDFGHICRDATALIDPERRLNIAFPDIVVSGQCDLVRLIMHAALQYATDRAGETLQCALVPVPQTTASLALTIAWDQATGGGAPVPETDRATRRSLDWLMACAQAHGGTCVADRGREGRHHLTITLPEPLLCRSWKTGAETASDELLSFAH